MAVTRSAAEVWLLGMPEKEILGSSLPTNGVVLRNFMYHHLHDGLTVARSAKCTIDEVLKFWSKARIPTQRADSAVRKLQKLFNSYCLLKKSRLKCSDICRFKEEEFRGELNKLFDISTTNALVNMKNEEDKKFLVMQQKDPSSCSMAGVDKSTSAKEARRRVRDENFAAQKRKQQIEAGESSRVVIDTDLSSACDDSSFSETDNDFEIVPTLKKKSQLTKKRKKRLMTSEVAGALDRVKLPDRGAMFVISAVSQALGCDMDDVTVSRTTIQRARKINRTLVASEQNAAFSCGQPLLLHWDGKLLPDIAGGVEKVDRIAILVTGGQTEQLLAVPKIASGTGQQQCNACLSALDDWQVKHFVQGLVFDTTAANTGLKKGACALLEKELGKELVWIPCRHHIYEVVLSAVFSATVGSASVAPDIELFKQFQKAWISIDKTRFDLPPVNVFDGVQPGLKEEVMLFYSKAVKEEAPRDDYRELLQLCFIFLGGQLDNAPSFRAPGATHRARWMNKAIYVLKMFLFRRQFNLPKQETQGIADISVFVALIYGRFWHEAPIAERAPLNDMKLLQLLGTYHAEGVKKAATEAVCRHLWFLSEHLVTLALFDERVYDETKIAMVANFDRPPNSELRRRLNQRTFTVSTPLQDYVTSRSLKLFDLLCLNGQENAKSFLGKPPSVWKEDPNFLEMKACVKRMKVVNDCAERGIALIQTYNNALTKQEDQKQYLLQLVASHRKTYPKANKATLAALAAD